MRGLYLHKTVRVLTHFKIFRLVGETINETKLFSYSFQHGKREKVFKKLCSTCSYLRECKWSPISLRVLNEDVYFCKM